MTSVQRTHSRRFRTSRALAVAAIIGLGASLAACGPQASPPSPSPSAASASASATAAASSTAATPSAVPSATPSPSAITPTSSAPASTALCTAGSLTGSLDKTGGGAAGHIYMKLILANTSDADCILDGYPGVSLIKAGTTKPIGAPADRDPQAPSNGPITLAPGQSAAAVLRYTQADNYQDCQRVPADAVLVYPPSATDSLEIPSPLTACINADIKLLSIGAFQA
ncbi:MAG: DUF4232 domain-containing protein [Specibacter sp.]